MTGEQKIRDREFPHDPEGYQACQLCGQSVVGRPMVQLGEIKAWDGKSGFRHTYWYDNNDAAPPGLKRADPDDIVGPVLHLEPCLVDWLWGYMTEIPYNIAEQDG